MLSRQELCMRRVAAGIEVPKGWRRSNRWLLPHPITHRSYCPSVPAVPSSRSIARGTGTLVA
jgi:hypothetical protein